VNQLFVVYRSHTPFIPLASVGSVTLIDTTTLPLYSGVEVVWLADVRISGVYPSTTVNVCSVQYSIFPAESLKPIIQW